MTDIISNESRTTSGDFPSQRHGESDSTATGVGKVANPPSGGEPASIDGEEYPPQLHTGKVGYGPNYHQGPTTSDKFTGFKEEIVGGVKRDQELKQHGHDLRTGEIKRREEAESQYPANPEEKQPQPPSYTQSMDSQRGVLTEGDEPGERVGEGRADMSNP